jgi:hypothetical protein
MTTDLPMDADPADVAEQRQDAVPPEDEDGPEPDPDEVPLEADEADVAEQRTEVPGWGEGDEDPET